MAEKAARTPRFDVGTVGETMLRLSVPLGTRLERAHGFDASPGGAESNVGAALAALGRRCTWLSRLPDNPLGRLVLRRLREAGLDTSAVVMVPEGRLGVYYAEFAAAPRAIRVVYDRAHSAMSAMTARNVDWDYLLDSRALHLTGITPALSPSCHEIVREALARAGERGVLRSFDVNYRSLLWPPEEAARVLRSLLQEVDLLICGRADAEALFGFRGEDARVLEALRALTPARQLVLTKGEGGAAALDGEEFLSVPALPSRTVDRFGAGDAFAAGVLDGLLDGTLAEGLRRGAALAALALGQRGDMVVTDRVELTALLAGEAKGIIR